MSGSVAAALGGGGVDIAAIWSPANFAADFGIANNDLVQDAGLTTAVALSLFCDRVASPGDALPYPTLPGLLPDRRGWWGDLQPDGSQPTPQQLLGSRLWLLRRAPATQLTALQAQAYCTEALAWLTQAQPAGPAQQARPIAQSVTVATAWEAPDRLKIVVTIARAAMGGGTVNTTYDLYWANT